MLRAGAERLVSIGPSLSHSRYSHHVLDAHMIKSGLRPPLSEEYKHSTLNLDGVLNYCGIPNEPDPHNALTGALCHAEVASRLLNDVQLLPEFKQYPILGFKAGVIISLCLEIS